MEERKGSRAEAPGTLTLRDERVEPRRLERSSAREEESQESGRLEAGDDRISRSREW